MREQAVDDKEELLLPRLLTSRVRNLLDADRKPLLDFGKARIKVLFLKDPLHITVDQA